jgi:hypothetical protein
MQIFLIKYSVKHTLCCKLIIQKIPHDEELKPILTHGGIAIANHSAISTQVNTLFIYRKQAQGISVRN